MTREEFVEKYFPRGWKPARTGSGAVFKNLRGFNVAVMERDEKPGHWKWRIRPAGSDNVKDDVWSEADSTNEEAAKRAVLGALARKIGL